MSSASSVPVKETTTTTTTILPPGQAPSTAAATANPILATQTQDASLPSQTQDTGLAGTAKTGPGVAEKVGTVAGNVVGAGIQGAGEFVSGVVGGVAGKIREQAQQVREGEGERVDIDTHAQEDTRLRDRKVDDHQKSTAGTQQKSTISASDLGSDHTGTTSHVHSSGTHARDSSMNKDSGVHKQAADVSGIHDSKHAGVHMGPSSSLAGVTGGTEKHDMRGTGGMGNFGSAEQNSKEKEREKLRESESEKGKGEESYRILGKN